MKPLSKSLLTASITGFAAGSVIDFSGINVIPALSVTLPLGAVFFGMFLISFMMEKEMAKFDEEESRKWQLIQRSHSVPATIQKRAAQSTMIQLKEKTL